MHLHRVSRMGLHIFLDFVGKRILVDGDVKMGRFAVKKLLLYKQKGLRWAL